MPLVVAKRVDRKYVERNFDTYKRVEKHLFLVEVGQLAYKYNHFCIEGTDVSIYFSRIFNDEFKVVMEPRRFSIVSLMKVMSYKGSYGYISEGFYLDINDLATELSIPEGYYAEILLTSLRNKSYGEKIVFPNEIKIDAVPELESLVEDKIETLKKIGRISESKSLLEEFGLSDIAKELGEGYSRFEIGDCDGAIKAYRKVIEGFRDYLKRKETREGVEEFRILIDNSKSRTEELIRFLNVTYSLLSNFGEHYGTHAYDEEGVFAHKLIESVTEYLMKKLQYLKRI